LKAPLAVAENWHLQGHVLKIKHSTTSALTGPCAKD